MTRLRTLFSAAQKNTNDGNIRKYYSQDVNKGERAELNTETTILRGLELVKYKYLSFIEFDNQNQSKSILVSLEDINEKLKAGQGEVSNLLVGIARILSQITPILSYRAARRMIEVFKKKYNINENINPADLYDAAKLQGLIDSAASKVDSEEEKDDSADFGDKRLEALKDINSIKDFINYYVQRDLYAMYRRLLYNIIYRNAFAYTNNLDKSKNRIGGLLESLNDLGFYPLGRGGLGYTINVSNLEGIKQSYSKEEENEDLKTFAVLSNSEQRFIIMILVEIIRLFSEVLLVDGKNPNDNPNVIKEYYIVQYEILNYLVSTYLVQKNKTNIPQRHVEKIKSVCESIPMLLNNVLNEAPIEAFKKLYPAVCWLVRSELQIYMNKLSEEATTRESEKVIHDPDDRVTNLARLRNASHFLSNYDVLERSVEEKSNRMITEYLSSLDKDNNSKADELKSKVTQLAGYLYELYKTHKVVLTSPFIYDTISSSDFIKEVKISNESNGYLSVDVSNIPKNLLIPVLFSQAESKISIGEASKSVKVYRTSILFEGDLVDLYRASLSLIDTHLSSELEDLSKNIEVSDAEHKETKIKLLQGFIVNSLASMNNSSYVVLVPTFVVPVYSNTFNISLGRGNNQITYERLYLQGVSINDIIKLYENLGINLKDNLQVSNNDFFEINSMYKGGDVFIYDTKTSSDQISISSMQNNLFVTR